MDGGGVIVLQLLVAVGVGGAAGGGRDFPQTHVDLRVK